MSAPPSPADSAPHSPADSAVRQAADVRHSVWISAHAGTGKTYVLVTRLAALLLRDVPPQKILCLTYMRAAATEMNERLLELLGSWVTMDEAELTRALQTRLERAPSAAELQLAPKLYALCLDTPGGLRLQTIHSFCQELLNRFALEAGLAPGFRLMDEVEARHLQARVRDRFIMDEAANEDFALLSRFCSEEDFPILLANLRGKTDLLSFAAEDATLQNLKDQLDVGDETADALQEESLRAAARSPLVRALPQIRASSQKTNHALGERIGAMLDDARAELWADAWRHWCEVHRSGNHLRKRLVAGKDILQESAIVGAQDEFARALRRISAARMWELTQAFLRLARAYLQAYARAKKTAGLVDYDDLIDAARHLLRTQDEADWVRYKLDGGIDHVLLDEAQDTSHPQWEIIRALSEEFFAGAGARNEAADLPRSLFAVGDEKQSILSFQGADPRGFAKMRAHFSNLAPSLREVTLAQSRRAAPVLLQTIDRIFAEPELHRHLLAPNEALQHAAYRDDAPGYVEVWNVERVARDSDEQPQELQAIRVAQKIKHLLADGAARPDDIMILLRSRGRLADHLQHALKERDIPVMGVDRMKLNEQLAVMDLCNAGKAALLPQDDLALATFLRSPLGGASEAELENLAAARGRSLWAQWQRACEGGDAPAHLQAAHARFVWCLAHANQLPPYEFFARLLGEQGAAALLRARLGAACADPIEELLNTALAYEHEYVPSLQGFLHWLSIGDLELKRDMEQGSGEVRIMTVHAAKGLEAPIVFLPDCCDAPHRAGAQWRTTKDGGILWMLPKTQMGDDELQPRYVRDNARLGQQTALAEHARLLYVALTRARDRLYIGGYLRRGGKDAPEDSWYDWISAALQPFAKDAPVVWRAGEERTEDASAPARPAAPVVWRAGEEQTEDASAPARPAAPPKLARAPAWLHKAAQAESPKEELLAVSSLWGEQPFAARREPSREAVRFLRGRHVHFLLEHLPRLDAAQQRARGRAWLQRHLPDFDAAARDELLEEVLRVLATDELQPFFAAHAKNEVPLIGAVQRGERLLRLTGRMDVMVETGGEIWIGDYKTDRAPPASPDAVSPALLSQMAGYRALMRARAPATPIVSWLIWSKTAHGMRLPDALLDKHWR